MKRSPIQMNRTNCPEALAAFLRDAAVFDSSCSPEAKVFFIDKDEGYFLKTAGAGTLQTEAQMTEYMHSLRLSAEVLYYGAFKGRDWLLTRRIAGEDCTDPQYLADPKRLCDSTAGLLRALHETDAKDCPVERISSYAETVRNGFTVLHYEPDLFRGLWEFPSFEDAKRAAAEGLPLLRKDTLLHGDYCMPNIILNDSLAISTLAAAGSATGTSTSSGEYGRSTSTSGQRNIQTVSWTPTAGTGSIRRCSGRSPPWR